MPQNQQRKFFCTRPSLTGQLMSAGFVCEPAINPYDPKLSAWSFDMTPSLVQFVVKYYENIQKTPPKAIRDYLKTEDSLTSERKTH